MDKAKYLPLNLIGTLCSQSDFFFFCCLFLEEYITITCLLKGIGHGY
jgi:hypothetical protein